MRALRLPILAVLLVAVVSPLTASAQDASPWHRFDNPDGSFSVEMPCDEGDVEEQGEDGTVGLSCWWDDLIIGALLTSDGMGAFGSDPAADFDGMLADARNDPATDRVELWNVSGARAFRIWGAKNQPLALAQIVERRPGEMIVLAVMEEAEGALQAVDPAVVEQLAARYFDSLEIAAQ